MLKDVPVVRDLIKRCLRCGLCREVCPVFNETKREDDGPRGKVFYVELLRNGELQTDAAMEKKLYDCLMCESCRNICPSSIPVNEMVAAARAESAKVNSHPLKQWVYRSVWSNPDRLSMLVKSIGLSQRLGLVNMGRSLGITNMLPGDMPRAEKIMGSVPKVSARQILPAISPAVGKEKHKVLYFLGCATDLLYPEVAQATVKVLTGMGCEVDIMPGLKCCGLPHLASGEEKTMREIAEHNARLISSRQADAVISDCASCTSALRSHIYKDLLSKERSEKIMDVHVFINKYGSSLKPVHSVPPIKVTYHDPCHLVKAQKITQQPRDILKSIPGVTFVEMTGADKCCGGAGAFAMNRYDLSMKILKRKVDNIEKTGANVVATACPGCITQLRFGLSERNLPIEVLHPLEIMAKAF